MRHSVLIAFLFLFPALLLAGQELYVTTRIGPLLRAPDPTVARVGLLRQGDALERLGEEGDWYHVRAADGTGYIQLQFVGEEPSAGRVAEGGLQNISTISTRRRASAYTTPATATRGLSAESTRERENLSFNDYDFKSVRWIKGFTYNDEELLEFAEEEGLGL